jgi:hypothetical protein
MVLISAGNLCFFAIILLKFSKKLLDNILKKAYIQNVLLNKLFLKFRYT